MENISNEDRMALEQITELSHEYGTADYLKGGGGNSSVKNDETLWVKPSGCALTSIKPSDFLPMVREEMQKAYIMKPPQDTDARERMIKDAMAASVQPGYNGRASVEAPLHESLEAKYVMHTHPAVVNGMTCAKNGAQACRAMFPEYLWVEYIDPGYTLCMKLRDEIAEYRAQYGKQPKAIFLKNHGLFVGADTPEQVREIHDNIMDDLISRYDEVGISSGPTKLNQPSDAELQLDLKIIKEILGDDAQFVCCSDLFDIAEGPVTPDHIVYHKAFPYVGILRAESMSDFKEKRGYNPKVIKSSTGVYAVSSDNRGAELAMELAIDGAQIKNLAEAFGGVEYMTDEAASFIENWEVEAFRRNQVS